MGNMLFSMKKVWHLGGGISKRIPLIPLEEAIYVAIVCVLALIFVVLLLLEESRWMLKNTVIAMAINYLAVPLVLFLIQNIIPLIAGIILIAVLILVAYLFFGGSSSEEKFLVTVRDGIVDSVHKISEK